MSAPSRWASTPTLWRSPGDSLQDVTVLQNMGFVMKGGVVYKDKLANTPVVE